MATDAERKVLSKDLREALIFGYPADFQDTIPEKVDQLAQAGGLHRVKKIAVAAGDYSSETDTTEDLPAAALVRDVLVYVSTADAGVTVDIGTLSSEDGGDADGFADALSVAATGWVRPQASVTAGGSETYYSANTRGALLADYIAGTNADGDFGLYHEKVYATDSQTAKSVSITSSESTTAVFDIYVLYDALPGA